MTDHEYLTIDHLTTKELTRLFSKITVNPVTGCWIWNAAKVTFGYGAFWWRGRQELAHRAMFSWLIHPLPRGRWGKPWDINILDHVVCDNPSCCFPAHLEYTTNYGNLARTNSISSVNRRKTRCIRGHQLPDKPNRYNGYGRKCIACLKITNADYYQRVGRAKAKTKTGVARQAKALLAHGETPRRDRPATPEQG